MASPSERHSAPQMRKHRAKKPAADESDDPQWDENFALLVKYQEENGHCNVPIKGPSSYLGNWVLSQRSRYRHANHGDCTKLKRLSQSQIDQLNSIGFQWEGDKLEIQWNSMYERLRAYKASTGNCLVPSRYKEDPELSQWVRYQRKRNNKGKLSASRKQVLESLGFHWAPQKAIQQQNADIQWEQRFQELSEFKQKHGHCRVPSQRKAKGTSLNGLSQWVSNQRLRRYPPTNSTRERRPMPQDEIDRLDSIGFIWKPANYEERWKDKFERLRHYKFIHGHCRVPQTYDQDRELGVWVNLQRRQYKNEKLSHHRIEQLEEIGFEWLVGEGWGPGRDTTALEDKWHMHYERLLAFFDEHGHCFVPALYDKEPSLGGWVSIQRRKINDNQLSKDRKKLLDDIGFVSKVEVEDVDAGLLQRHWDDVFERLKVFKAKYGHCRVPCGPSFPDQQLSLWVSVQRTQNRKGILPESRRTKLDDLGFLWEPGHRGTWVLDKDRPEATGSSSREEHTTSSNSQDSVGSDSGRFSAEGSSVEAVETVPPRRSAMSESAHISEVQKGSRLALYDSDEDTYYNVTVNRKKKRRPVAFVECDDGDCGWVDLEATRFRLLSTTSSRERQQQASVETASSTRRPIKRRKRTVA